MEGREEGQPSSSEGDGIRDKVESRLQGWEGTYVRLLQRAGLPPRERPWRLKE